MDLTKMFMYKLGLPHNTYTVGPNIQGEPLQM